MTYYIHKMDPVIVEIFGPLAVRWYGLSYLLGFVAAYFLLQYLSKKGLFLVAAEQVQTLVLMVGFIGVFVGGRLGYCLFYGTEQLLHDPLFVFKVWEGGMSSHGGMIGVILYLLWYARRNKIAFLNLTDNFACVVPMGILFGRLANFINGELWGRITTVRWAVIFPQEGGFIDPSAWSFDQINTLVQAGLLHPRHPSQLYEAFGEGLLLFAVLWFFRFNRLSRKNGVLSAIFLVVYAVVRITVEFFREPDDVVYFGWLTKGQSLSGVMILVAIGLVVYMKYLAPKEPEEHTV